MSNPPHQQEYMKKEITTKAQLLAVLKHIPIKDTAHKKSVICSLIGHSRIQTIWFGYYSCSRCGEQLGDNLASIYMGAESAVVVGHNCAECRASYKECTWKDKYLAPNPFKKEP